MHRKTLKESEESSCFLDKKLRTIYISGEISDKIATRFRRYVRALDKSSGVITLELNSPGGDIESGLLIIDTIDLSRHTVIVRATGVAMSMAAVILACGDIREALPNTTIMVHQGTYRFRERFHDIDNEVNEVKRLEGLCLSLMDSRSGKTPGYWENRCGVKNLYLSADIAYREGLIDAVTKKG